jgi:hypothetical protein
MSESVLNRSFIYDLVVNFQANMKAWTTLAMIAISFAVRFGWIAPNSIDEEMVSNFLVLIAPLIAYLVPNRKQLSSGETVNVNNITEIVDLKTEQAIERTGAGA